MGEIVPYHFDNATTDDIQHRCQPFQLEWIFGFNSRIPLVNVTNGKQPKELVLASGNSIIFYKLENDIQSAYTLVAHRSCVNMITSDGTGRFVVSCDSFYCINVWDREAVPGAAPVAIRTIYEPFRSPNEINAVGISHDGRYLLAACSGTHYQLQVWQWTVGNDSPDDIIDLPSRLGKIKNISFCTDLGNKNHFVVTLENAVIFGCFDTKNQRLAVEVPKKHGFQDYNDSTFVQETTRAVSVTAAGMAIVWSDDKQIRGPIRKQFLKYLHLKYASINVIKCCDQKIVTGDDDGEIRFYDIHMRILYWFKQEEPEPIRTISFDASPRKFVLDTEQQQPVDEDTEVLCLESIPRDVSLESNPVIIRNFVMATKSGRIFQVDIVQNKIQELYYNSGTIITSFDVHPTEPFLCCCDGNGKLTLYDLGNKQARISLLVPIQRTRRGRIMLLRYSPCGTFLVGGAENGYIWLINPSTMIISGESPVQFSSEKINQLMFSPDSKIIAVTDIRGSIGILQHDSEGWKVIGRNVTHKVVDMLFASDTKMLTIGDDRHLVEYIIELGESLRIDSLIIGERFRIEQSAHTISMMLLPADRLLVANDQFKFKIFSLQTFDIIHTYLAPFEDGPARSLCLLPGDHFFIFMTEKNLYIHQLPIDGNPFKFMSLFAHPKTLKALRNVKDHFVFCYGEGDHAVSMWRINTIPLIENQKHSGTGLDPYCSLLPGGKTGCYVKEMLCLFFYNQISPKNTEGDTEITENNLMKEVEQQGQYFLTFEEVVKLFLNHRTLASPSCEYVQTALIYISKGIFDTVSLTSFNELLGSLGEQINAKSLDFYCTVLFPEYAPKENGSNDSNDFLVPLDEFADKLC
ncbi:cilia- and flagella-associated protein 251-like isoform X2 [Malaya genurostris]|uniref:cilia- and flagella-associated protein 251-like isoform X2 n=1 Tax=Malaya genurostris TaxID=325434 RepID=UPI0026F38554|nr:cilia- and flagella-associated protein 251-like isoform X2 [Malaya genurostris]